MDEELVPLQNREDSRKEEGEEDEGSVGEVEEGDSDLSAEAPECSQYRTTSWGSLPDVCLRHVFVFLSDLDRKSADLVCHHWHRVMRSPSLWRSCFFHFRGWLSRSRSEHLSAVTYARSLGVYLERLEVCVYPPRRFMVAERLEETISGLLSELNRVNAPLQSLSLTWLELDRTSWSSGLRKSLGLELLSALSLSQRHHYHRSCISSLDLTGFFSGVLFVHLNPGVPRVLNHLQSLTILSLSYSCLSDELLIALQHRYSGLRYHSSKNGNTLEMITLHCNLKEPHRQLVSGDSWATLASSCLDLKVKFIVDKVINANSLARILVHEIPLTEYSMTAFYSPNENWSAKPLLFNMLPRFRHSLQYLSLNLSNCNESLDEELLELFKVCERLGQLRMSAFLEIITVERLLQIRLAQRSSLNKIRVRIFSVSDNTEDQEDQLEETLSSYMHLPPELDFLAVIYPFVDH